MNREIFLRVTTGGNLWYHRLTLSPIRHGTLMYWLNIGTAKIAYTIRLPSLQICVKEWNLLAHTSNMQRFMGIIID